MLIECFTITSTNCGNTMKKVLCQVQGIFLVLAANPVRQNPYYRIQQKQGLIF